METVDLVILDAVENVGEIGLGIEHVQLCRFDDRHGAGQRFFAGIGARKEPVLAADTDRS